MTNGILQHLAEFSNDKLRSANIHTANYEWRGEAHAVLITRVSSQEQANNGYSLNFQLQDLRDYVRGKVDNPYWVNEGVQDSRNVARPTLLNAVRLAQDFNCPVVCWSLDRLVRGIDRQKLATLAAYNVPFVCLHPPTIANSIRQKRGFAIKRQSAPNELRGRPAYHNQEALDLVLEHLGQSWRAIAGKLNSSGIPTQLGRKWGHQTAKDFFAHHFTYIDGLSSSIDWRKPQKVGPTLEASRHIRELVEGSRLSLSATLNAVRNHDTYTTSESYNT